jgi:acyl dehydratase
VDTVEADLITPELRDLLGKELMPDYYEVEKGHIRRYAQATGDPNPLWTSLDYARKSCYGNIIAPPTFLIDIAMNKLAHMLMQKKLPSTGFLNGGIEIEYFQPIQVGDTITSVARLIDLKEKSSRQGKLLFMILEVLLKNQKGEQVLKFKNNFIAPMNKQE